MRGETLAYPLATYSVGEPRTLERSARGYALPALAIIATASAVVISFGQAPLHEQGSSAPGRSGASRHNSSVSQQANGSSPVPWELGTLQFDSSKLPAPAIPPVSSRHRPPHASGRIALTGGNFVPTRAAIRSSSESGPGEAHVRSHRSETGGSDGSPSAECLAPCFNIDQGASAPAKAGLARTDASQRFNQPVGAAEAGQEQAVTGELIERAHPALLADSSAGEIISANPSSLGERATEVVTPATPGDVHREAEPAILASAPQGLSSASVASAEPMDLAQAKPTQADVAAGRPVSGQGASETGSAVSSHLARVRERYKTLPTEKGAPVAASPEIQEARSGAEVAASLSGANLGPKLGSTIIVQDNELVAIKLSELISLFENRLDRPLFVWMRTSSAASKFVTSETLASAGIKTRYDSASKRLVLSVAE